MPTTVRFGESDATDVQVVSDTSLTCVVPPGVPVTRADVAVSTSHHSVTATNGYAYNPVISRVVPSYISVTGTRRVVVLGTFSRASVVTTSARVYFDGVPVAPAAGGWCGPTGYMATAPTAPGVGELLDVQVGDSNPIFGRSNTLVDAVRIAAAVTPLTRGNISPASAPAGSGATFTLSGGAGFVAGETAIHVYNNSAPVLAYTTLANVVSGTELTFTLPTGTDVLHIGTLTFHVISPGGASSGPLTLT